MQNIDFKSYFEPIPLTRHFAKVLEGQTADLERVHLIVTAERTAMVGEHDEGIDVATELPEIQRVLCSLYHSGTSLTPLQATRRSFPPQENLLPRQPSPRSILSARLIQ